MTASTLASACEYYLYAGLVASVVFLGVGIDRVSPGARGAYLFRILLVPGIVLLWPLVISRWLALERGAAADWPARHAPRRSQHAWAAAGLAIALPLILVVALVARETLPTGPIPQPLATSRSQ